MFSKRLIQIDEYIYLVECHQWKATKHQWKTGNEKEVVLTAKCWKIEVNLPPSAKAGLFMIIAIENGFVRPETMSHEVTTSTANDNERKTVEQHIDILSFDF